MAFLVSLDRSDERDLVLGTAAGLASGVLPPKVGIVDLHTA